MKKLILSAAIILFLATVFNSHSPPGWFQQTINLGNRAITDIFFLDSLNGWVATDAGPGGLDSGSVYKTNDGGSNWNLQFRTTSIMSAVQFVDFNTGYIAGDAGFGRFYKTTNGGTNWSNIYTAGQGFLDLFFINKDTGWICDNDLTFGAGLLKTTNGGISWQQQLSNSFQPLKLFFINKDTGWVGSNDNKLYRTTNSGMNWNLQFTTSIVINSIFFLDGQKGWIRAGGGNGVAYTTTGGLNWTPAQGEFAGRDLRFVNDSIGYSGNLDFKISKSTNGGKNWGYQTCPIFNTLSISMLGADTIHGWGGGTGFIKTTDGGGPITYTGISPNSNIIPSFNLKQNYPNPYNPVTNITFEVTKVSKISLKIFNIAGELIDELLDYEKHPTGTYTLSYEADEELSSGVYFYQMTAWTEDKKEIFIDTKKMILIK